MKKINLILSVMILSLCNIFSQAGENKDSSKGLKIIVDKKELDEVKSSRALKDIDYYSKSTRWAIIVGVNDYEDKFIADLTKAQNDAKVLSDVLKNEGQFDYIYTFTDDTDKKSETYPSLNNIVAKLDFLKSEIKPNDTLLFSFSGHGISDEQGRSYLLTADTVVSQPYKTSLPLYEIEDWIKELKISKNIVLLDACRNVIEKTKGINTKTLIDEKNSQAEISAVVYATSPGEFSYEHDKEPYGVFTTYIIEGLQGNADRDNDILITFNELRDYVEKGVREWALKNNKKQKPYTSVKGEFTGDVVLSVIPLKDRAKYNPYALKNSYKLQYNLHTGLNISGSAGMITGFATALVGGILFGVGVSKYKNLNSSSTLDDWDTYSNMSDAGFYLLIVGGSFGLLCTIPFGVSYAVKPKTNRKGIKFVPSSFDVGVRNEDLAFSLTFKF